jgi:hypothetical protein
VTREEVKKTNSNEVQGASCQYTSIIPAIWEVEIRRIMVQGQQNMSKTPHPHFSREVTG